MMKIFSSAIKRTAFWQTVVAIIVALIFIFPLYWMFVTALRTGDEMVLPKTPFFPKKIEWSNFKEALSIVPVFRYMLNTVIVTFTTLAIQLVVGILAAYGFARGRFKFRDTLFLLVLGALMIPHQVTFIPIYIMIAKLGWVDTYAGLVFPSAVSAYLIFMLRQNFASVDNSYLEAGKIDGLGLIGTIRQILVPMCAPSIITVSLVTIIEGWNSYFWPKLLARTDATKSIAVGLVAIKNSAPTHTASLVSYYPIIMAGVAISVIPVLIVFICFQKYMLTGYSKAAMK